MMTYTDFLLLFFLLPLTILVIFLRRRLLVQRYLVLTGTLMLVALMYMAPWDHIAAVWKLWTWTSNRTWGLRWWAIPPEEYLFCVLEALLAITLTYALLTRGDKKGETGTFLSRQHRATAALWNSQDEKGSIPTRVGRRNHLEEHIEESDQRKRS